MAHLRKGRLSRCVQASLQGRLLLLQPLDARQRVFPQYRLDLLQQPVPLSHPSECSIPGHGADAARACGDAFLGDDLNEPNLADSLYVRSAAQLAAEIADRDDADDILASVLVLEVRHRPCHLRLGKRHLIRDNGEVLQHDGICQILDAR